MRLRDTKGQALTADRSHVAQTKEVMLCVHLILLPTIDQPLALTGCSPCSTRSAAWKGRHRAPYNIARTGENDYRISVAVAGFTDADLAIEAKENTLTLRGEKQTNDEEKSGDVLYQGIAARAFERVFQLADHVQVKNASLENGLLHVDLVREIPEAKKPRPIPIGNGKAKAQVIETKAA